MASLRRRDRSPFWWACFRDPNNKRIQRSTKIEVDAPTAKERSARQEQAQALATSWERDFCEARTQRQAQRVSTEIMGKIFKREIVVVSIVDFLTRWASSHEGEVEKATLTYYRSKAKNLTDWLGTRGADPINMLTDTDVRAFRADEFASLAARTVNGTIKTLRMAFEAAKLEGLIADNPFDGLRALKVGEVNRRPFTRAELGSVLEKANAEWASMIRLGYYSGQRLKDVALLTWDHIDIEQREIRFVTSKTGRRMHCPIGEGLMNHLLSLSAVDIPSAPLHPRAHASVTSTGHTSTLSAQFGDLLASVGLGDSQADHKARKGGRAKPRAPLSFHSLRDTATTALKAAGVEGPLAMEIIGHESAAMSRIYTKLGTDSLLEAANKLAEI